MKMDSRGQAVPGQIAINREINLSGIRIQQQPPQSTGATEQNNDTKLAQLSPRGAIPTMPKSSASSKSSAPGAVVGASGSGKPNRQKPASPNASRSPDQKSNTNDSPAGDAATIKSGSKSSGAAGRARTCSVCASAWRLIRPARCSSHMVSNQRPNPRIDPLEIMLRARTRWHLVFPNKLRSLCKTRIM